MSDGMRRSDYSIERALAEQAGVERYQRKQDRIRSGDLPRPREFDSNGFPIPQRGPSFLERVARLLNP